MAQAKFEQAKDYVRNSKQKLNDRVTMDGILKQARESFEHFLDPKVISVEQRISDKLMSDAYGIVFLTEVKGAFLFGMKVGTGIIITRIKDKQNEWSAPIAIGTGGVSFGFQGGISKVDHIVILPSPEHVKTFLGRGQLQLKANANATAYKYGRDGNVGVGVGNPNQKLSAAPIISYSFGVKGLYGGISVDGTVLTPRNDCNRSFYGKSVTLNQIASGEVEPPSNNDDYNKIIELLNNKSSLNGNNNDNNNNGHTLRGADLPVYKNEGKAVDEYAPFSVQDQV